MNHLDTFTRQRAVRVPDSYNPDAEIYDWGNPVEITVEGYFEQDSSTEQLDPVRQQVVTFATLVIPDPDVDVRRGDRIVQAGKTWTVQGYPSAPRNLFTGWRPGLFVRLKEGTG